MRLTNHEQRIIVETFRRHFGEHDHLWLFGSRADPTRRGGDIDLYVETPTEDIAAVVKQEIAFETELWVQLGEQKIDVVLNLLAKPIDLPIYRIARQTGIPLDQYPARMNSSRMNAPRMNAPQEPFEALLTIANIHARRLRYAVEQLKKWMPVSPEFMAELPDENIAIFELYISRFSKLQDFIGSKLFTAILEKTEESTEKLTFIDKLNKLEKFEVVASASEWMDMRKTRNHASHEYPDHPELMARFFNEAYAMGPSLLACLDRIKTFAQQKHLL